MSAYRLGSLFSGIGGLELGFEMTGEFTTVAQVELNEWACQVLEKHWPNVLRFNDVREVGRHNLPECDVIVGGFPCQDVSLAGRGAGLEGERSGLWWEFHRIISEVRPRVAVVENVPGLFVRGFDAVLGSLAEIGYDASWEVVSAASQGAPHIRERVFIVAYPGRGSSGGREGSQPGHDLAGQYGLHLNRAQAANQPERPGADATDAHGERREEQHAPRVAGDAGRAPWRVDTRGGQWAIEPAIRRVVDGVPRRVDRLRGLGNAVVPQVAYFVAQRVLASGLLDARMEVAA
jgi:DNA (cytosine-5)-methyltransferase 1